MRSVARITLTESPRYLEGGAEGRRWRGAAIRGHGVLAVGGVCREWDDRLEDPPGVPGVDYTYTSLDLVRFARADAIDRLMDELLGLDVGTVVALELDLSFYPRLRMAIRDLEVLKIPTSRSVIA